MVHYHNQPPDQKKISNYIGECILLICNGLAKKSNFSGYTYIDEMISDGIENCIMALDSFDIHNPKKNPFWYFSKIAYYAFVRRIQSEKKQQFIKHKNVQQFFLEGKIEDIEINELSDKVIDEFERTMKLKKIYGDK